MQWFPGERKEGWGRLFERGLLFQKTEWKGGGAYLRGGAYWKEGAYSNHYGNRYSNFRHLLICLSEKLVPAGDPASEIWIAIFWRCAAIISAEMIDERSSSPTLRKTISEPQTGLDP